MMKTIYIGMDDTDNKESRGTGRLARSIGSQLQTRAKLLGVTRHQLLFDPRVPYTSHNSSAAICLETDEETNLQELFSQVKQWLLGDFQTGSDPGLCIAEEASAQALIDFGRKAKTEFVFQAEALLIAASTGVLLEGLAGSQDGLIGAMAAVGLAACGEDGRYILVGGSRNLSGLHSIDDVIETGICEVRTLDGRLIKEGLVYTDKLRPARRGSKPVLFVERGEESWLPIKVD